LHKGSDRIKRLSAAQQQQPNQQFRYNGNLINSSGTGAAQQQLQHQQFRYFKTTITSTTVQVLHINMNFTNSLDIDIYCKTTVTTIQLPHDDSNGIKRSEMAQQ
jgi:hypothetical protein